MSKRKNDTTLIVDGHEYVLLRKKIKPWATTDTVAREIVLSKRLKKNAKWDVLGHEIAHIWFNQSGVEGFMTKHQLESMCDMVGTKLIRFLKENDLIPDDNEDDNKDDVNV